MPRPNNDMIRSNIYLPRRVRDIYKDLSKKKGIPMSELIREDLLAGLKLRVEKAKKRAKDE